MSQQQIVVLKFGGTSVSTRERWETILGVVREHLEGGRRPVIVCSAVSGVSNSLEGLLPAAVRGEHEPVLEAIRDAHAELAAQLEVDADALVGEPLEGLARVALGTSLTGVYSPKLVARVMSAGELMSTRLGEAFLRQQGLEVRWQDARQWLRAVRQPNAHENRHYLSAACDYTPDAEQRRAVLGAEAPVVLTQGFIARDEHDETVLLGRGGSDTSAAYLAARLGATHLEIWTDVPGMFTANPRDVPGARLLRQLGYDEAQELATMGAKVLHPRCIDPVRRHDIPLHIRCTPHPDLEGTIISAAAPDFGAQVKAISAKGGVPLISMETVGMWQQVGFLADVFEAFKRNGLSVDLVATSETNVTASLDPQANALDDEILGGLLEDLRPICRARQIGPCAAVSLVGHDIRAILHRLGPALEVFEEHRIYLMSQAASDLNMTFVVDEEQAARLVRKLHAQLFGDRAPDELVGPTWRELFQDTDEAAAAGIARARRWWSRRRDELLALVDERDAPLYVYDVPTLERAVDDLERLDAVDRRLFALKANPHPQILELFHGRGLSFECVSPGEIDRALGHVEGLRPDQLLFTPNFAPIEEYADALARGVQVTLDNLHPLEHHPEVFADREIFLRLDPGAGKGHHKHVRTAGAQSKFGLALSELDRARALADAAGARITGLHVHVGSGIRSSETWAENAMFLARIAGQLPEVRVLDLGGGMGVPERPGQAPLPIDAVAESLRRVKQAHPNLELWIEPGRYCVATAGVLLARVTQLKRKGERVYVGVETGMNSLIRPSLYGAFHEIVNLTRLDAPAEMTADVVGPICETGDVLGYGRRLPNTQEGDVLLLGTTGAYGRVMSSNYNLREPAREVLLR